MSDPTLTTVPPSAPRRWRVPPPIWLISFFAWLWKIIVGLWGLVILALIGDFLKALVTTGVSGATDPRTWTLTGQVLTHPWMAGGISLLVGLLSIVAYRADVSKRHAAEKAARLKRDAETQVERDRQAAEKATEQVAQHKREEEASRAERERAQLPYVLKRVKTLDPSTGVPHIAHYIHDVYLPRETDREARAALHQAASGGTSALRGICIFGRPTLGKTRLAWEALRAELPDWTFIRWPHLQSHTLDFTALRNEHVVLWIDDLHEFTTEQETHLLVEASELFAAVCLRLVIVATCRDGNDEINTGKRLNKLLERLTPLRPASISDSDADQLAVVLKQKGEETLRGEFDGTPGSVLLGVGRMRNEIYPVLPESARHTLWAMKLLRSAGIYYYPESRVRETAVDLFSLISSDWQTTRVALLNSSFLRIGAVDESGERSLAPMADVYLERAVPDFPATGDVIATLWPDLASSLIRRKDAEALNSLGVTFNEYTLGNQRFNKEQAIKCHRAALKVYTRDATPDDWAMTEYYLGIALDDLAGLVAGQGQVNLLKQAIAAYRTVLEAMRPSTPTAKMATADALERLRDSLAQDPGPSQQNVPGPYLYGSEVTNWLYESLPDWLSRPLDTMRWMRTQAFLGTVQDNLDNALQRLAALSGEPGHAD